MPVNIVTPLTAFVVFQQSAECIFYNFFHIFCCCHINWFNFLSSKFLKDLLQRTFIFAYFNMCTYVHAIMYITLNAHLFYTHHLTFSYSAGRVFVCRCYAFRRRRRRCHITCQAIIKRTSTCGHLTNFTVNMKIYAHAQTHTCKHIAINNAKRQYESWHFDILTSPCSSAASSMYLSFDDNKCRRAFRLQCTCIFFLHTLHMYMRIREQSEYVYFVVCMLVFSVGVSNGWHSEATHRR